MAMSSLIFKNLRIALTLNFHILTFKAKESHIQMAF